MLEVTNNYSHVTMEVRSHSHFMVRLLDKLVPQKRHNLEIKNKIQCFGEFIV